jgi:dTDP-4-dehydrorhamnose reductase
MWLIVGGGGQLGRCMATFLEEKSTEFIAVDRASLNVSDPRQVSSLIHDVRPTVILNAAAWTAVDEAEDHENDAMAVNAIGPRNLAKASVDIGARLIHISTDYVFNGLSEMPYPVDFPTEPLNAYGRTKLAGEEAVRVIGGGRFPIIRTAWLYSELGNNFAKTIATRALRGDSTNVVYDQFGQPTSAHDLARLIFQISQLESPPSIVHGTNGGRASWFEFAREIYLQLGTDPELVSPVDSAAFVTKAKRPSYSVLDHSDFEKNGIVPLQDWRLGLADVVHDIQLSVEKDL